MPSVSLIVPAAGSGTRMQNLTPKILLPLCGKPILYWTLSKFAAIKSVKQILLPVNQATKHEIANIVENVKLHSGRTDITWNIVEGGDERIYSINNCIPFINQDSDLVAVHDAVRPLVSESAIEKCFTQALSKDTSILALPLRETLKEVDTNKQVLSTPDRTKFWSVQTPQCFKTSLFKKAYALALEQKFFGTDDASVVEFAGFKVNVTEGNPENIKITYPIDLELAELLLSKSQKTNLN